MGWICGFDGRSVGPAMQPISAPARLGDSGLLCAYVDSADRTRKHRQPFDERRYSDACNELVRTCSLPSSWQPSWLFVLATASLFGLSCSSLHVSPTTQRRSLPNWQGIDTSLEAQGINLPGPLSEYRNAQFIQRAALASQANVVVFPETSVHRWNSSTDLFWGPQLRLLQKRGKTLLIGADVSIPGGTAYKNVVIIRGDAATGQFQQRVPLPVAMWKPGAPDSVPLNLNGPGTLQVGHERAAILVCYEQLLVWPVLSSMAERPSVLVGMANDYWAKDTIIPAIQHSCLQAWARLFDIPLVKAVNF